ncbi:MAG: SseB family protein [Dermatophilaceae bacterium]
MTNPRDHARHPQRVGPDAATDSAGLPWARRALTPSGFENDSGASDPAVLAALVADDEEAMMAMLAAARLLVAVVAHADEMVHDAAGLAHDTAVDMALVTLTAPDGRRALPAFTGVAELAAWDQAARPVPVAAATLAQAAIAESCQVVVVNLGLASARELRPSQVWALAMQRTWLPPDRDPFVHAALGAAVASEPEVTAYGTYAAQPAGTVGVELTLVAGLDHAAIESLVTRVGERLATDGEFRARIDGLAFRLAG